MYYLFNYPLFRYILKLNYKFFHHKSLGWVLLLIILISVIWTAFNIVLWMRNSCCCALSYITITGKRYYTSNNDICYMIRQLIPLGNFLTQDIDIIQKKLECLPWIRQVSIRMQWPDTLKIHVIEHIPVAIWNDLQIISTTGAMLNLPEKYQDYNDKMIPVLYGPGDTVQEILIYYYIFDEILKKSTKLQIKTLKMDMRYSWQIVLKNNMCIKLGRKNIIERLNYFIKIYPMLLYKINESDKCIDYIDLRYTAGFAVKWIPNIITSVFYK